MSPITLRPARKSDATTIVSLLELADTALLDIVIGLADRDAARHELIARVQQDDYFASYRFARLAEHDGEIVGLIVAYPGELETTFSSDSIVRESTDDAYHIESISTVPAWRGRGVGTLLLDTIATLAITCGCTRLSLLVDPANTGACRLYQRLGFIAADRVSYDQYHYQRLFRPLTPAANRC
ncbi:N-acetyltransferase [Jeongeupia sp. HS-3]|uniref:GNAT family N-acetyltransferase n=1 Tax=Jeongeupia sp. HS-3 TaxID=1009682 RepID=UPI0018A4F47D|nr:GNAT family N-acetyltransferase [Jeongeupia sp. HS-3]BCL76981.1 N-acetyltransferase [Jeongeupia sp. HS-3]